MSSQLSSVGHVRTGRPVHELSSVGFKHERKPKSWLRKWANQDSSGTTTREKSRWLSSRDSKTRIPGRLWQKKYPKVEWNDRVAKRRNLSCSSRRRTTSTRSTTSSWTFIGTKSRTSWSSCEKFNEMEELKRFQGSTFGTISRGRLIEDRGSILELTGMIQELQNEINCMNDLRDFQDAESVRCGQSHVPSQPALLPLVRDPGECWAVHWECRAAKHLGHAWYIGKRFCKSNGVFFCTLSARVQSLGL